MGNLHKTKLWKQSVNEYIAEGKSKPLIQT